MHKSIVRLRLAGATFDQIAKELRVSKPDIAIVIANKLTAEQAAEINAANRKKSRAPRPISPINALLRKQWGPPAGDLAYE